MAPQTYDELVVKATAEELISEDWDTNLQICDKVQAEGEPGAKAVVIALLKRLAHRNPNVQIFALELANSLVQNNGKTTHSEISSRAWTGALDRLVNDRTTVAEVKKRALKFIKDWTKEFGDDANLGVMKELYVSLEAKKFNFDGPAKPPTDNAIDARLRQEEEELQRVLALSMQDKGGRNAPSTSTSGAAASGSGSSSRPFVDAATPAYQPAAAVPTTAATNANPLKPYPARSATPPPVVPSKQTASRVRAIYPFVTQEKGELGFERGEVIKVIDRMYDEWYTGAVGGRIGIFPISYVEPLPDPTAEELQREAQEEAKVFAAQGMIVKLQRMLDALDPTRGDRLDDPALEDVYQKTVALQPQIVALMKKYADQKAELEHIHLGFAKASRQYVRMTQPQQQQGMGGVPPGGYGYEQQQQQAIRPGMGPQYGSQGSLSGGLPVNNRASYYPTAVAGTSVNGQQYPAQPAQGQGQPQIQQQQQAQPQTQAQPHTAGQPQDEASRLAAEQHAAAWAAYYAQQASLGGASGDIQGAAQAQTQPQAQPEQTAAEKENIAAWQGYYAALQAQGMEVPPEHAEAVRAAMAHPLIQPQGAAAQGPQETAPATNQHDGAQAQPQIQAQAQAYPQGQPLPQPQTQPQPQVVAMAQPAYGQSPYGQGQGQVGTPYGQHPAATSRTSLNQPQPQAGYGQSPYGQGQPGGPQAHYPGATSHSSLNQAQGPNGQRTSVYGGPQQQQQQQQPAYGQYQPPQGMGGEMGGLAGQMGGLSVGGGGR